MESRDTVQWGPNQLSSEIVVWTPPSLDYNFLSRHHHNLYFVSSKASAIYLRFSRVINLSLAVGGRALFMGLQPKSDILRPANNGLANDSARRSKISFYLSAALPNQL